MRYHVKTSTGNWFSMWLPANRGPLRVLRDLRKEFKDHELIEVHHRRRVIWSSANGFHS